jgi:hypothetical protein
MYVSVDIMIIIYFFYSGHIRIEESSLDSVPKVEMGVVKEEPEDRTSDGSVCGDTLADTPDSK